MPHSLPVQSLACTTATHPVHIFHGRISLLCHLYKLKSEDQIIIHFHIFFSLYHDYFSSYSNHIINTKKFNMPLFIPLVKNFLFNNFFTECVMNSKLSSTLGNISQSARREKEKCKFYQFLFFLIIRGRGN